MFHPTLLPNKDIHKENKTSHVNWNEFSNQYLWILLPYNVSMLLEHFDKTHYYYGYAKNVSCTLEHYCKTHMILIVLANTVPCMLEHFNKIHKCSFFLQKWSTSVCNIIGF
jgi:hypothetical protein